ncbi:MAG: ribonuclease HI [Rhodospirillaceae bacterium]|nr:ribonuclease HI [Rhodospirillaceae bacterium]|tara:strand:- start:695 stop:1147 length:453 start_codon:yes stop_codon:yes gene_type:complete
MISDGEDAIDIYTDGACLGNPGPGGWAALIRIGLEEIELYGGEKNTTNNRMEMMAVIEGLSHIESDSKVSIYTDSKYVQKGMTEWIFAWKKRNWKTASKNPVKNIDLWRDLDDAQRRHTVSWNWVKGHSGNKDNERVDMLARLEAEKFNS